ncbi:protein ADM2a [Betta splendens]|uniref:Protein ADM2a n=1 Tax=Betta splendens TaxID=158456 RepID=A0A8M1HIW7_BETSP|nr:protein ADM2a [Betta splendens]
MRSLLPLTLYCISLVSLRQPLVLAQEESPDEHRLDFINQREDNALVSSETTFLSSLSRLRSQRFTAHLRHLAWARLALQSQLKQRSRVSRHKGRTLPSLEWALPTEGTQVQQRLSRVRRHAALRGGHYQHNPQLMRVGCVLGTCQVQNLSHRLYQLIGQTGREDSSPINPRSPHSFG